MEHQRVEISLITRHSVGDCPCGGDTDFERTCRASGISAAFGSVGQELVLVDGRLRTDAEVRAPTEISNAVDRDFVEVSCSRVTANGLVRLSA